MSNYHPDAGANLRFDYPLDLTQEPIEYLDAAITNLFYWNNMIHDFFCNVFFGFFNTFQS